MGVALAGAIAIAAWSQLNAYLVGAGPATEVSPRSPRRSSKRG